jgi:hypothetical protein
VQTNTLELAFFHGIVYLRASRIKSLRGMPRLQVLIRKETAPRAALHTSLIPTSITTESSYRSITARPSQLIMYGPSTARPNLALAHSYLCPASVFARGSPPAVSLCKSEGKMRCDEGSLRLHGGFGSGGRAGRG